MKLNLSTHKSLTYDGDISFLKSDPIVEKISDYGNTTGIRLKNANQSQQLLKMLLDRNVTVKKFDANDISLQEIFIDLAGHEDGTNGKEVRNV
jgi:ABC-type uncharacterized transport system ATPase subunit